VAGAVHACVRASVPRSLALTRQPIERKKKCWKKETMLLAACCMPGPRRRGSECGGLGMQLPGPRLACLSRESPSRQAVSHRRLHSRRLACMLLRARLSRGVVPQETCTPLQRHADAISKEIANFNRCVVAFWIRKDPPPQKNSRF